MQRRRSRGGIATLKLTCSRERVFRRRRTQIFLTSIKPLAFLARHPRIDGNRIGIMGFSWGGNVTVLASKRLAREYAAEAAVRRAPRALPGCSKR